MIRIFSKMLQSFVFLREKSQTSIVLSGFNVTVWFLTFYTFLYFSFFSVDLTIFLHGNLILFQWDVNRRHSFVQMRRATSLNKPTPATMSRVSLEQKLTKIPYFTFSRLKFEHALFFYRSKNGLDRSKYFLARRNSKS